MEQLKELLDVLGSRPILAPNNVQGKQALRLARWLGKQEQPTDEAARKALKLSGKRGTFRKIKYHLRIYLLNSITSLSTAQPIDATNRLEINRSLWHQLTTIESAPSLFHKTHGQKALKDIIELAGEKDLPDQLVIAELANLTVQFSDKTQRSSHEDVRVSLYRGYASSITRQHHSLSVYMNKMLFSPERKIENLKKCITELDQANLLKDDTISIKSLYLKMKVALFENDLASAKLAHDQAMVLFDCNQSERFTDKLNFKANLIRCYIKSTAPLEGLAVVEDALRITAQAPHQQYMILELGLLLVMKGGNYQQAYEFYKKLVANPRYLKLTESQKETILIMKAYLALLRSANLVEIDDPEFQRFRIHKFLNNLKTSLKEKNFRNTHTLIIRILDHCFNKRDRDFDFAESTKKYIQRHLSAPENYRAKNFLLALIQYPENGYDIYFTDKKAAKYLSRMKEPAPTPILKEHSYMEIIPYEKLWELAINYSPALGRK